MSYRIFITPEAESDLDEIFSYVAQHYLAPQAAANTLNNIKLSIKTLKDFPGMGVDVSDRLKKPFSDKDRLKMIISGKYLVFYVVDQKSIVVLRVIYQRRNWIEIFGNAQPDV